MLKKLRENRKKGFTLVELIVVLVILAILAALLIPALTGYIDKAKEKQIIAETRQAVMAAQTLVDEVYATKAAGTEIKFGDSVSEANGIYITYEQVTNLAELKEGTVSNITVEKVKVSGAAIYSKPIMVAFGTNTPTLPVNDAFVVRVNKLEYNPGGAMKCTYTVTDGVGTYKVESTTSAQNPDTGETTK